VDMFSGDPVNELLLLFGQRKLNRLFGAAHEDLFGESTRPT
jgi:hypothetical protein